ncbi:cap-specific mRNA (nucleoside-2'-O-)-methyltransferase 2 [Lepeophtheirus salmonis]|uniref:cap-specific mRNA (nucleoside-2'-O-)-methyltransferase 2 n=1 Tax=Lepeophtheirus salmonis TaxID=72036 RepID=UPI003AF3BFC7
MNAFTVDEVFSKRIDLEDDPRKKVWPSPFFLDTAQEDAMESRFQSLKDSLNLTKSSLNHLNLKAWHQHTCSFNSASSVMQRIKHHIKPELFTQAWVKMIEILNVYFPSYPESMKTLHICESPGAFISATNHHFQRIKWSWKALSLNPYYEGNTYPDLNNDDRHSRCNLSNWDYGTKNTGSVIEDIEGYFDILRGYGADLVTADGSINCLKTPNEQENMVLRLKTAEIILALNSLKIGGSFVIKLFTFFEPPTIKLLYILNLCFDKMSIFKPIASKEGNSEVYIISKGYNGKVMSYLSDWLQNYVLKNSQNTMFSYESIPKSFKDWIYNSAVYFSSWQKKVIERNLISYNIGATEPKEFKHLVLKEFFYRYPLKRSTKKIKGCKIK